MNDAPTENVIVNVRGRDVHLDPANMRFNEITLSDYMDKEYGWIDYFGKQLEFANKDALDAEIAYEAAFAREYVSAKDLGGTENYSKQKAASDPAVTQLRKDVAIKKEIALLIKAHLKAWDKNHDNAQNRGHTLRKELDKLNRDIRHVADPLADGTTCAAEDFFQK